MSTNASNKGATMKQDNEHINQGNGNPLGIDDTYPKEFHCHNCGRSFTKRFPFGEVARKGDCPFCGVSDEQLQHERTTL